MLRTPPAHSYSSARGSSARGSSARGSSARGSSARGSSARGSSARGSSARGSCNRGFTLIEMLVALAISSIILLTLYSVLNQTIVSKRVVDKASANILKQVMLAEIINNDFRQGYANSFKITPLAIEDNQEVTAFTLKTQNSLFFNNAIPVSVEYYLHPSGWFVRVEIEENMRYYNAFPLLPNIQNVTHRSYDIANSTYTDNFNTKASLFNFEITLKDNSTFNITVPSKMLNR